MPSSAVIPCAAPPDNPRSAFRSGARRYVRPANNCCRPWPVSPAWRANWTAPKAVPRWATTARSSPGTSPRTQPVLAETGYAEPMWVSFALEKARPGRTSLLLADAGGHVLLVQPLRQLAHAAPDREPAGQRGTTWRVSFALKLDRQGDARQVEVSDQGTGLPASAAERVKQPFVHAGDTGGSGLGLAIVDRVARQHGGDLVLLANTPSGLRALLRVRGA